MKTGKWVQYTERSEPGSDNDGDRIDVLVLEGYSNLNLTRATWSGRRWMQGESDITSSVIAYFSEWARMPDKADLARWMKERRTERRQEENEQMALERKYSYVDYEGLPEELRGPMERYIERGILPGDFLRAVISDSLSAAFFRADSKNEPRLKELAAWAYNNIPQPGYGSKKRMMRWARERQEEGEEEHGQEQ